VIPGSVQLNRFGASLPHSKELKVPHKDSSILKGRDRRAGIPMEFLFRLYLIKAHLDSMHQLADDHTVLLGEEDLYGQMGIHRTNGNSSAMERRISSGRDGLWQTPKRCGAYK